jgi:branched-chain amino acid transport system substrate-binding protein
MNQKAIGRRQFSVGLGAAALGGFNLAQAQGEGRIVLGQSAPFTGPSAQLGIQFNLGAKLFFDRLNAQGGVGRRTVEIRTMDDGYEPDRCAENTRKLIADDVFALFGYIGTPTSLARRCRFSPRPKCRFLAPSPGLRRCASPSTA